MNKYSSELKDQVIKEVLEVGSTSVVAKKHGLNTKTVFNWVKGFKNKDLIEDRKTIKFLNKKIQDQDLEIQVLRELLKKTFPHWNSAEKL